MVLVIGISSKKEATITRTPVIKYPEHISAGFKCQHMSVVNEMYETRLDN